MIPKHALVTALLVAAAAGAADLQSKNADVLATATILKLGFIGIASHVSEEEMALAALLRGPDPYAQLKRLLQSAKSNEAKLYALCGLRNVSKAAYEQSVAVVKWDGDSFNLMRADVIAKAPIKLRLDQMGREGCAIRAG